MSGREAVLFRAHRATPGTLACFERLVREVEPARDVWVVGQCEDGEALAPFRHPRCRAYSTAALAGLGYPYRRNPISLYELTGQADLPVLLFFREHPDYARYWIVEYDVRYTGNWRWLLDDCGQSQADLLGTTVMRYAENPAWANWPSVDTAPDDVPKSDWAKAFIPFGAATPRLLAAIDARCRRGWRGYFEALWGIAALHAGLAIEDIGGRGSFVPQGREGRHYWNTPQDPHLRPGSFVFRPTVAPGQNDQAWQGEDEATRRWAQQQLKTAFRLVHPVKD